MAKWTPLAAALALVVAAMLAGCSFVDQEEMGSPPADWREQVTHQITFRGGRVGEIGEITQHQCAVGVYGTAWTWRAPVVASNINGVVQNGYAYFSRGRFVGFADGVLNLCP